MSKQIGYVLAGYPNPQVGSAIEAGAHPRPEYMTFLQRNNATLLTYYDIKSSKSVLARVFVRRGLPNWGLAAAVLSARSAYDGLLTTGEDIGLPLALQARAIGARIPIYIITHGSFFASWKFRWVMNVLHGMHSVHYLCLSEMVRRAMIDRFSVPESRVHNTNYGVDTQFFRPIGSPATSHIIAGVGMANRDYRTLVRAAMPLGVDLKIAADSAWFPTSLDIADDNLPSNVEARSWNDYASLRELYARALFVVVPLYQAQHACGYSAIAEAMAMGKAVIATRTQLYSDFIIDKETGFYVSPGDVRDLRAKLVYLLENPDEAYRMGERARARIEKSFSVEAYCQRIEHVIRGYKA